MNKIGLEVADVKELAVDLNDLLANYQIFYMNVRGFHWNIKGDKFFELHVKFEELYGDLQEKIDEVAERILTLGKGPLHNYRDFLELSDVPEYKNVSGAEETVSAILECLKIIIAKQRIILDKSDKMDDEGTNALMSDYIREQEKLVWMYSSFLNKN